MPKPATDQTSIDASIRRLKGTRYEGHGCFTPPVPINPDGEAAAKLLQTVAKERDDARAEIARLRALADGMAATMQKCDAALRVINITELMAIEASLAEYRKEVIA